MHDDDYAVFIYNNTLPRVWLLLNEYGWINYDDIERVNLYLHELKFDVRHN